VLELPVPPKSQRERIIRTTCASVLAEPDIKRLAACEELAPAVVTRAAQVVTALSGTVTSDRLANTLQDLIDKTLIAQGHQGLERDKAEVLPEHYDPALINCNADLNRIARQLKQHGNARLCLYGPPGTGKTAYARWLATQLDKPLHIQRGADLFY
jgi:ATP-dependent Lon protease